jgi:excinuclease ABC subunit C
VRDPGVALDRLAQVLKLDGRPRSIVGLDMATLQGSDSVGSLVHFVDGTPFKDGYRRFKIRTVEGVDDFAMMREVVTRYFSRLVESDLSFPDLVLIDGGKGQVSAVVDAFRDAGYAPPPLVGLAKREELLIRPDQAEPITLPRNDPGLQLLQYVRDEAHRFAGHYHLLLRKSRHFTPGGKGKKRAGKRTKKK